jgi:hypothetical protein
MSERLGLMAGACAKKVSKSFSFLICCRNPSAL